MARLEICLNKTNKIKKHFIFIFNAKFVFAFRLQITKKPVRIQLFRSSKSNESVFVRKSRSTNNDVVCFVREKNCLHKYVRLPFSL